MRKTFLLTAAVCVFLSVFSLAGCRRKKPVGETVEDQNVSASSALEMADSPHAFQLLRGFHGIESGSWRWTEGHFAVALRPPLNAAKAGAVLEVQVTVPSQLLEKIHSTTLSATAAGRPLGSKSMTTAGDYVYTSDVPSAVFNALPADGLIEVDFALDKFAAGGVLDARELGVVVRSIALKAK